ncbi:MAG: hypothetical protein IPK60_24505 [Sandaracinaceae bacterium]|nr:hypothetical protein [Sandaracinaceae bacterium]
MLCAPILIDGAERAEFDAKDGFRMTNYPARGVVVCKTAVGSVHVIPLKQVPRLDVVFGPVTADETARVVEAMNSWEPSE